MKPKKPTYDELAKAVEARDRVMKSFRVSILNSSDKRIRALAVRLAPKRGNSKGVGR